MSFSDEELDALLGAYALDAVEEPERRAVEEYLLRAPQARDEVRQHHEVAMALATTPGQAPAALWDRIAASMPAYDRTTGPAATGPAAPPPTEVPGSGLRHHRAPGGGNVVALPRRRWTLPSLAAAAVAAVAFGSVAVHQTTTIRQLKSDVAAARSQSVSRERTIQRLASTSGTAIAHLQTPTRKALVDIVVGTDGQGYLISRSLPPLPPGHLYQLWGVADDVVLSLGVLGSSPSTLQFAAHEKWTKFVLTEELSPGVASSTQPAVAAGDVETV